jgi:hypothetical protein
MHSNTFNACCCRILPEARLSSSIQLRHYPLHIQQGNKYLCCVLIARGELIKPITLVQNITQEAAKALDLPSASWSRYKVW